MNTNPVLQEHSFGCGVAAVAYALSLTYRQALTLFDSPDFAWKKGYLCKHLIEALDRGGAKYAQFYFRPKHKKYLSKPGVIVYTKRSERYPAGHYLARSLHGDYWMNSWSNFPVIHPVKGELQKRLIGDVGYILVPEKYLTKH